jgi:tetratricopeptide (TPR) repeat protein
LPKRNPNNVFALKNRGIILHELKRFEEALASYRRALTLRPDFAETLSNHGNVLRELKRFEEALTSYDRALTLRPDLGQTHFCEALCRLLMGDFDRGWAKFQLRRKRKLAQPEWLGSYEIRGKVILLHAEESLGDTIQFCRYVPLVAERAARVILEVQAPLHGLMSTLPVAAQIVSRSDRPPEFDVHCPLHSLPLAFGTRLETIPVPTPYLRATSGAMTNWNARLGRRDRPRIGLAWSGNPENNIDHKRSMTLSSLLSLFNINATFVSLQKNVRAGDAAVLKACSELHHFGDELKDFFDTAALISTLDLVISVDTSVAHLAGALAKPVWIMLPFVPDWRWLLDRDDSPWYPTARLFRQDNSRAWDSVIPRVHAALDDFIRNFY